MKKKSVLLNSELKPFFVATSHDSRRTKAIRNDVLKEH
jgi:hypothetical protein